jgi:hypothetical protein
VVRADLAHRGAKARQDVDGLLVTVGVGESSEAAQVHESEGALNSHGVQCRRRAAPISNNSRRFTNHFRGLRGAD